MAEQQGAHPSRQSRLQMESAQPLYRPARQPVGHPQQPAHPHQRRPPARAFLFLPLHTRDQTLGKRFAQHLPHLFRRQTLGHHHQQQIQTERQTRSHAGRQLPARKPHLQRQLVERPLGKSQPFHLSHPSTRRLAQTMGHLLPLRLASCRLDQHQRGRTQKRLCRLRPQTGTRAGGQRPVLPCQRNRIPLCQLENACSRRFTAGIQPFQD